jgi:hypothetical protein
MNMNKFDEPIEATIIHSSDSNWGTERDIHQWHIDRGFDDTGYHFVIMNGFYSSGKYLSALDGQITPGRPIEYQGAHCKDNRMNRRSIGICLIGTDKFSLKQFDALYDLHNVLCAKYGTDLRMEPHNKHNVTKSCPNFDPLLIMQSIKLNREREEREAQELKGRKDIRNMTVGALLDELGINREI